MRRAGIAILMAAIGISLAGGCSQKETSLAGDGDTSTIPTQANPTATTMTQAATEAIQKKSYAEAVMTVLELQKVPGMTPEQFVAFKNIRMNLQNELANAATAGDQKALEAIQLLRAGSTGGR